MTHQPSGHSIGPYAVVDLLGEGGMGQVLRCVDPKTGQHVAVKVLNPALTGNTKVVQRFERELQVMLALRSHPNIVTVLDFVSDPFALVMEMLAGETMHERLQRLGGGLPLDEVYRFFTQILEAVDFAHEEGILHRDIKSANVMLIHLGAQDHVKVMDFGLAGFVMGSQLTRAGTRMGTPAYMAPEQHLGGQITRMTDVYSLGALLFEVATGRLPYPDTDTTSDYELMKQHIEAPIPLASSLRADLPPGIDELVLRAMQKAASSRYPSCAAFLEDLRRLERGGDVNYGLRKAALEGDRTGTTRAFQLGSMLREIDGEVLDPATGSTAASHSEDGASSSEPPTGPPPTVFAEDPRPSGPPPTILEDEDTIAATADPSIPDHLGGSAGTKSVITLDDESASPSRDPSSARADRRGMMFVAAIAAAVVSLGLAVSYGGGDTANQGEGQEVTEVALAATAAPGAPAAPDTATVEAPDPAVITPPAPPPPAVPTQLPIAFASATSAAKSVRSSHAGPIEYDAGQAIDGDVETWWQENQPDDGIGEKLLIGLGSAPLIHRLRVVPGYWKSRNDKYGDRWTLNNRVARADITIGDRTFAHDFADRRGWHDIDITPPVRASRVILEISGVYSGRRSPTSGRLVRDSGFSEVQVWGTP